MIQMVWNLPRINPINKIMGKRIVIDKRSRNRIISNIYLTPGKEKIKKRIDQLTVETPGGQQVIITKENTTPKERLQIRNLRKEENKRIEAYKNNLKGQRMPSYTPHQSDMYGNYLENKEQCSICGEYFNDAVELYKHKIENAHYDR